MARCLSLMDDLCLCGSSVLNNAVKVTVDGEAYDGDDFFKFALVNEDFYAKKSFLKPQDFLVKSYIPEG